MYQSCHTKRAYLSMRCWTFCDTARDSVYWPDVPRKIELENYTDEARHHMLEVIEPRKSPANKQRGSHWAL
jgi:hypothetical protein